MLLQARVPRSFTSFYIWPGSHTTGHEAQKDENYKYEYGSPVEDGAEDGKDLFALALDEPGNSQSIPNRYRNRQAKMPAPANASTVAAEEPCKLSCTSCGVAFWGSRPCNAWAVSVPVTMMRTRSGRSPESR